MKYFNEDSGIFSDDEFDEDYEMAENAESNGDSTYWEGLNSGYVTPSHTWKEIEGAYKKLNLTREPLTNLHATPDDWLDTGLWIKSLKETI